MKTVSDTKVSADLEAFLADLEFRLAQAAPDVATGIRVLHVPTGSSVFVVEVYADGDIEGRRHLRYYGIDDGSGVDGDHAVTRLFGWPMDAGQSEVAAFVAGLDIEDLTLLFRNVVERPMTDEERAVAVASLLAEAKTSPEVATFAGALDMEALTAFGPIPLFYPAEPAGWIAGPDVEGLAMRRFVLKHPLLAGIATNGSALFDAATGDTVEEAYGNLTKAITECGFPLDPDGDECTGGVPAGLVAAFEGVSRPEGFVVLDENEIASMADFLRMAQRLPQQAWPPLVRSWKGLVRAGYRIALEDHAG